MNGLSSESRIKRESVVQQSQPTESSHIHDQITDEKKWLHEIKNGIAGVLGTIDVIHEIDNIPLTPVTENIRRICRQTTKSIIDILNRCRETDPKSEQNESLVQLQLLRQAIIAQIENIIQLIENDSFFTAGSILTGHRSEIYDVLRVPFKESLKIEELTNESLATIIENIALPYKNHLNVLVVHDDGKTQVDPTRFKSMLTNIFNNAVKYTPEGTNVEIVVVSSTDHTDVIIIDNGPGFNSENPEDLLAMGAQDKADHKDKGHGIGLAHCADAAKEMGGSFRVAHRSSHELGTHGTMQTLSFPKQR